MTQTSGDFMVVLSGLVMATIDTLMLNLQTYSTAVAIRIRKRILNLTGILDTAFTRNGLLDDWDLRAADVGMDPESRYDEGMSTIVGTGFGDNTSCLIRLMIVDQDEVCHVV